MRNDRAAQSDIAVRAKYNIITIMKLRVFFSWQTSADTKNLHNKQFLIPCIHKAAKEIANKGFLGSIEFDVKDGTTDAAGTPEMIKTCENRIDKCHIYLADYTIELKYNWLIKFIYKLQGQKVRTNPNANVMHEIGRARGLKDDGQIILLMNTINGGPEACEHTLPVDLRHLRRPIEFRLKRDKKKNGNDEYYSGVEKKVVGILKKALFDSAKVALKNMDNELKPFIKWKKHNEENAFSGGYIWNDGLRDLKRQLLSNKGILRLNGLSGLGKTRLVLESFRESANEIHYLYCDCHEHETDEVIEKLDFLSSEYPEAYLVFDNCDLVLLGRIVKRKKELKSPNPIITIYNDPNEDKDDDSRYLALQDEYDDIVEQILSRYEKYYDKKEKGKLIEFAGGIPMIAELLIEGIRRDQSIGVLSDESLISKILGVSKDDEKRTVLRSLSLFDYFGYYHDRRKEMEYIATNKNITSISADDEVKINLFDSTVISYLERNIMERKGRFVGIRPTPIALYLASEWISQCSTERLLKVIKDIQTSEYSVSLTNSFSDQFKNMGHNKRAKMMLNTLLGEKSPFGNAEVINTDLGSRLFRSFVEVNPEAVADCLWNVIGGSDIKSLVLIDEGRRNLVWTIEKLCFEPTTFERGAEMMLLLGLAENERISNNATGQFSALFPVLLPATAATLEQRLIFLQKQKQYGSSRYAMLLNAIGRALRTRDYIYFSGAEQRGTEKLKNYQPKTYKEIHEYIKGCLDLLMKIVEVDISLLDRCCEILESNLGCLCDSGYGSLVMPCVHKIVSLKNNNWDKMLDAIRFVLGHKKITLTDDLRTEMEDLITTLSNDDFFFRFSQVEKKHRWDSDKFSFDETMRRNNADYEALAKEMASDSKLYSVDILKKIYSYDSYYGSTFGYVVAQSMDAEAQRVFVTNSILAFKSLEKYNFSIYVDFIRQVTEDVFASAFEVMKSLANKGVLFACVSARNYKFDDKYPESLYELVKDGNAVVCDYEQLWRFMPLGTHSEDDLIFLFKRILSLPESFKTVTHMSMLLFWGASKDDNLKVRAFVEDEIANRFDEFSKLAGDDDYWHILRSVLDNGAKPSFASSVMHGMMELISNSDDIHYKDYNIEDCMGLLIGKYFNEIWPELSEALVSDGEEYMLYYNLKSILGSMTSFDNEVGILFKTNHTKELLEWCAKYPNVAPERLMLIAPLYEEDHFSDIVLSLLDLYGEQESVLTALSCNMGSFSFVGSVVPLYEKQYHCIEQIANHQHEVVRQWAVKMIKSLTQQIVDEKNRDEEGFLGYR